MSQQGSFEHEPVRRAKPRWLRGTKPKERQVQETLGQRRLREQAQRATNDRAKLLAAAMKVTQQFSEWGSEGYLDSDEQLRLHMDRSSALKQLEAAVKEVG